MRTEPHLEHALRDALSVALGHDVTALTDVRHEPLKLELDAYASGILDDLAAGMRAPRHYGALRGR